MADTLGGVSFGEGEGPHGGEIQYVRQLRRAKAKPLGYTGNINTTTGVEPLVARFTRLLDTTTMNAIKALYDAGDAVAWVYTDSDMGITSRTVTIETFDARKNDRTRRTGRWECEFLLEEVV